MLTKLNYPVSKVGLLGLKMSAYSSVVMLNSLAHQQQKWVYRQRFHLNSDIHIAVVSTQQTLSPMPTLGPRQVGCCSISGTKWVTVTVGEKKVVTWKRKILCKFLEPWKSSKWNCCCWIVPLLLYCFKWRKNGKWTDHQRK